jgi:hypothetical protein
MEVIFLKRRIIATLALALGISTMGFANNTSANQTEAGTIQTLPAEIGKNILTKMLKQQEIDFEKNSPLKNKHVTKLTESDDANLYYLAMTEVEGQKLKDFSYNISEVQVYKDEANKIFVEAYVTRTFIYGDNNIDTGFGDHIKFQINEKESDLKSKKSVSNMDNVMVLENTSDKTSVVKPNEFLERYKAEVSETPQPVDNTGDEDIIGDFRIAAYTYSGTSASNYARLYALEPNYYYPYFKTAGDCTNFVSQSLYAGGIPKNGDWFMNKNSSGTWVYSYPWIHAGEFRDYIRQTGGILMQTLSDTYSNAQLGDVYHYDTRNNFGLPYPDGEMEHAAIVTKKQDSKIYVSYHTTNRLNVTREYYTSVEGGDRFLSHIVD